MAIFLTIVMVGVTTVVGSFSTNQLGNEETFATLYAQEGIEAARSIKNQGWQTPFQSTSCISGCGITNLEGSWKWLASNNVLDGYTRTITVTNVQRDGNGNVVESGGTDDPDTKKISSEVSWNFSPTRNNTLTLETYLTNFRKSIVGNWALPQVQFIFDLTADNSGAAQADAISIAYASGYVYLGRSSSGGTELQAILFSGMSNPSLCANCQRELGGDINDIEISGNYAYIASSNNSQELQVIDISSPTSLNTATLATVDLTSGNSGNNNADAIAIATSGTNLYMARNGGNELIKFDISTPTNPSISATNSEFEGTPSDMVIVGNYAYITSDSNTAELQIFNLSTLARIAVLNLNEGNTNANALSVTYADNDRLLLGRAAHAQSPELYSINIQTPVSPQIVSTVEIGNDITDLSYGNALLFLAVSNNNSDFQIINANNLDLLPTLPAYAQLNIANSPRDLLYNILLDKVFIANSNNSEELIIIEPD